MMYETKTPVATVSTVRLDFDLYQTCLFYNPEGSQVVQQYSGESDARAGHEYWAREVSLMVEPLMFDGEWDEVL